MKTLNDLIREIFTWGTPACGAACGVIGAVAAIMIIAIGFWKTVFVALLAFAGAFIGGVKDKPAAVKKLINRVLPGAGGQ